MTNRTFIPSAHATTIFEKSKVLLMSHSIQAVIKEFAENKLNLIVIQTIDQFGVLPPDVFSRIMVDDNLIAERIIKAKIMLHRHLNKHTARFCIAHEMAHLLIQLEQYKRTKTWPLRRDSLQKSSSQTEEECNVFAHDLCFSHNEFNKNDNLRKKHMLFPSNFFNSCSNPHNPDTWADGMGFDVAEPFNKPF